jgi:hypothetical protein
VNTRNLKNRQRLNETALIHSLAVRSGKVKGTSIEFEFGVVVKGDERD